MEGGWEEGSKSWRRDGNWLEGGKGGARGGEGGYKVGEACTRAGGAGGVRGEKGGEGTLFEGTGSVPCGVVWKAWRMRGAGLSFGGAGGSQSDPSGVEGLGFNESALQPVASALHCARAGLSTPHSPLLHCHPPACITHALHPPPAHPPLSCPLTTHPQPLLPAVRAKLSLR